MSSKLTIGQTVRVLPPSPFAGYKGLVTMTRFADGVAVVVFWGGWGLIMRRLPFKLNLLEAVKK